MRPHFDQIAFFDGIVEQLREEGVFRTYDAPLGAPSGNMTSLVKTTHDDTWEKNVPGQVWHLGDQPYDVTVRNSSPRYVNPTQEQINLKADSIRKAIKAYIPPEPFAAYVRFFSEHLDDPSHRRCLDTAFDNMHTQFSLVRSNRSGKMHLQYPIDRLDELRGTKARFALFADDISMQAAEQPKLVLAFAVFQAAHIGYLDQLGQAIDRSGKLTKDELENAHSVVSESFRQFDHFLLFESLLPLTLHHQEKIAATSSEGTAQEGITLQAIAAAWQDFDRKQILTADDLVRIVAGSDSAVKIVCPAKQHLRATQNNGILPALYAAIIMHEDELGDILHLAQTRLDAARSQPDIPMDNDYFRDTTGPWNDRVKKRRLSATQSLDRDRS